MYCKNCGSQIDDNAVVCPHCGVATDNYYNYNVSNGNQEQKKDNYMAIIGFALSFIVAIAGLICSIIGYRKAPEYNGNGKSLALAGIIISVVELALSAVAAVIIILAMTSVTIGYGIYL